MYVNTDISRTMDWEQRAVYTSELTLSRTLTLSLKFTQLRNIPTNRFLKYFPRLLGGSRKGRCAWNAQELELQHEVDLSSWKLAKTWHGSSLSRGLSRGLDDISHSHSLNALLDGMGEESVKPQSYVTRDRQWTGTEPIREGPGEERDEEDDLNSLRTKRSSRCLEQACLQSLVGTLPQPSFLPAIL